MHNYLQKLFLIFLFCMPSFIYAMENSKLINAELEMAIEKAQNNQFTKKENCLEIMKCIEQGADPNYRVGKNGRSLIGLAVEYENIDLLKHLIKYNADVNQKDNSDIPPLKYVVEKQNINHAKYSEIIKELCNAGVSLIVHNFSAKHKITAFHYLALRGMPKQDIEVIITHARFYDQAANEQLKKQIITSLLVFNKLSTLGFSNFPPEIRFRILSNLILDFSSGFNERFRKKLIEMNCNNFIFSYLENRVENINKILQFSDQNKMIPRQWWDQLHVTRKKDDQYNIQVQLLLDGK